ncbi:MAG: MFS transporter [Lachnospiraceae bacterium]|nr:MFS transporter [Lachnospiraceae bacterium]
MKSETTALERKWIWYDVGNSAFTMLAATLLPIFFHTLAGNAGISETEYLAYWAYATSVVTVLVAVLGTTLGSLSDLRGAKGKFFLGSVLVGTVSYVLLGFAVHWVWFLLVFVLAKTAYQLSLVIYDSMLCDITAEERMDEVSAKGYAWGYIGSCVPFVATVIVYVLYAMLGLLPLVAASALGCAITALWWLGWSFPLWKSYQQTHYVSGGERPVREGLRNLGGVFTELAANRKALWFLVAFFFFIDGVYTIIDMATSYGTSLGLDTVGLLAALLVTQVVAFPSALLFGRLSRRIASERLITVCIAAYFAVTVYAAFMTHLYQFWILAIVVGLFQGSIQSLARSYFAKIIPREKSGEYFGIYDIFGKGASFTGTLLVGLVTQLTGSQNIGVGVLSLMFPVGLLFFLVSVRAPGQSDRPGPMQEA